MIETFINTDKTAMFKIHFRGETAKSNDKVVMVGITTTINCHV
jgi:hypothetical protein